MFPSGNSKSSVAEVEVVQPERLLEHGRVLLFGQREDGEAVVEHVVPADLVGAVRKAVRMLVVGRREQQLGRVGRAARRDDDVRREALGLAVHLDDDRRDLVPRPVRLELDHPRVRHQRHVGVLERRPHAEHLGVGLGVDEAGEAVARRAADAVAVGQVRLGQPDAARRVERAVAGRLEVVGELLDPRLVCERRERVRARSPAARSGPPRARRGPRRAARRGCSRARSPRTRSARPARCRRHA